VTRPLNDIPVVQESDTSHEGTNIY